MTATRDLLQHPRPGDRWLVAVAHPDDESFGCGSLIAHATTHGAEVTLVCATRGEAGESTADVPHEIDLGTVREAELRRAAGHLGVARIELLGYRDSGFDGECGPGALCSAPVDELAVVLGRLVEDLEPTVVIVLDGSDGHRDHVRVRAGMLAALAAVPGPAVYEFCLPNSLLRRWLDEMRSVRPGTAYHALDPSTLGRDDADITDVLDTSGVLDRREAAIAEHRSQTSPFDGLSPDLRRAFLTVDHLARVDPVHHRA